MDSSTPLSRLIGIMAALRTPKTGCPWDLDQTFATIAPYTIEEAYEVADAIARNDLGDLKEELGDLLLQVVFHSRMAEEQGAFAFDDVAEAINAKMIRRHPHVFGERAGQMTPDEVKGLWGNIKATKTHKYTLQVATSACCKIWVGSASSFCNYTERFLFIWYIGFFKCMPGFIRFLQSCIEQRKNRMGHSRRTFPYPFFIIRQVFFYLFFICYLI